tara:strand:- start:4525 stop:4809 length:285 start_codon:yes stop_codon:yes gene_type:complete
MSWCGYCGMDVPNPCLYDNDAEACQDSDMVTKPNHYSRWKIEPSDFIMKNDIPWAEANAIKYIMRHDAKNGLEDLEKAKRYIDMAIEKAGYNSP